MAVLYRFYCTVVLLIFHSIAADCTLPALEKKFTETFFTVRTLLFFTVLFFTVRTLLFFTVLYCTVVLVL